MLLALTVLIVDDDPVQRRLLENSVNKLGYRSIQAASGEEAISVLTSKAGDAVALLILDLVMPDLDGMGVLGKMRELEIDRPVIVQTSKAGIDIVVSAVKAGADDFCVKPVSFERLKVSITNALKQRQMRDAVKTLTKRSTGTFSLEDMIASSPSMERTVDLARRAAGSNIPVLIEGESGVGKEVLARAIQGNSDRAGRPFVVVNCGALPENLVESILFGHEKGAFTGAVQSQRGKFVEADGGTLFLDEVGELPLDIQVKLLRALQEGEVDPVGARHPVKTDVRIVSATNRNMIEMVQEGSFREDLYYRLNVFPITVPPLRNRKSDIGPLVDHLAARLSLEEGRRAVAGISASALSLLERFDWPGNIRQLENTLFRALVLCDSDTLDIDCFPQIAASLGDELTQPASPQTSIGDNRAGNSVATDTAPQTAAHQSAQQGAMLYGFMPSTDGTGNPRQMASIEQDHIRFTIDHHKGRMTKVARSLGIGRSTLYRKLAEMGYGEPEGEYTSPDASLQASPNTNADTKSIHADEPDATIAKAS
ncbi:MAG: sigma-54 dependent transcriptional regulator [Pseudomonadota bacterium]